MADNDHIFDISSFISWFISQCINIFRFVFTQLDRLILVGNFSLLDFCITIFILIAIVDVVVASVSTTNINVSIREKKSSKEDS